MEYDGVASWLLAAYNASLLWIWIFWIWMLTVDTDLDTQKYVSGISEYSNRRRVEQVSS